MLLFHMQSNLSEEVMALADFHSKSAEVAVREKESEKGSLNMPKQSMVQYIRLDRIIYWYGDCASDIVKYGAEIGFTIKPISGLVKDTSLICGSKALVLNKMVKTNDVFMLRLIAFAQNYGISVIWINDQIDPGKWIWGMRLVSVGKRSIPELWRKICQITG